MSEKIDLLLYFGVYNLAHQHILCSIVCRPCPLGVGVGWGGVGWGGVEKALTISALSIVSPNMVWCLRRLEC